MPLKGLRWEDSSRKASIKDTTALRIEAINL